VIRFTPRKKTSNWSAINVKRVAELTKLGRMKKAGLDAFAHRKEKKTGIYTHEQRTTAKLDPEAHKKLERDAKAWAFFQSQPAWYRKAAVWWVVSAKQEETRERRLSTLISDSARGRTIPPLTRKPSSIESK